MSGPSGKRLANENNEALRAGELTPEGLTLYQPHAPLWALSLRIEMALVWLRESAA